MRVKNERDESPFRARAAARTFGETLARLRSDGTWQEKARAERRREAVAEREPGARAASAGPALGEAASPDDAGPDGLTPDYAPRAGAQRPRATCAERDGGDATVPASAERGFGGDEASALPPLRELVRALVPAIDAARVREGQALELSFGVGLRVDLRVGRDGVELTLRPDARLARAAAAEVPGLVRALSARGIRVAGARVEVVDRHPRAARFAR
jgi:hypothetical protein